MSQIKRPRIDGDDSNSGMDVGNESAAHGLRLAVVRSIELPSDVGSPSAISAWVPQALAHPSPSAGANAHAVLVVGTCSGSIVLVYDDGDTTVLENPGGPAIQALLANVPSAAAADIATPAAGSTGTQAELDSKPMPDVIAGDAEGHVTLYTLGRRFSRNTLPAPVSALAAVSNPNAPSRYLVGDMGGRVASCHAQETIWKVHVDAMAAPNSLRPAAAAAATPDVMVNAVCEVWMPDRHGLLTNYMAVASGHGDIQLFALSMLKHTIPLACPCTCVCPGIFTGGGRDREDKRLGSGAMQAVLGDEAGRLFVLDNFEVEPYAQLDYPIIRVFAVPLQSLGDRGTGGTDIVVCQTRSDTVFVLHNRRVVATYTSDFWPAVVGVTAEFGGIGPAIAVVDSGKPGVGGDGGSSSQASIHIVPLCPLLEGVGL